MCAIICSFDTDTFRKLYELNSYRGTASSSFALYDVERKELFSLNRRRGRFDVNDLIVEPGCYGIGHIQAPTTEEQNSIHPVHLQDHFLWHNGILKPKTIETLQEELTSANKWDTYLLLKYVMKHGYPEEIDGSFACILVNRSLIRCFRNLLAPLNYDANLNISSTKFEGSIPLPANAVFELDLQLKRFIQLLQFRTVDCPYSL